jgi:hypothetical protein
MYPSMICRFVSKTESITGRYADGLTIITRFSLRAVGLLSPGHTPADTVEILRGANKDLPVGDGRGA